MANSDGDLQVVDSQPIPELSVVSSGAIPPESMMHRWWRGLTTPLPRTPGSDEEAVREGSGPALAGLTAIGTAGVPVEAIAARSLAPFAPLIKGAIGSAAGSWLGGKAGGLVGQEKAGSEIGGAAGGLYGAAGGKIPTNMAELEAVLQSPEAKARAAQEAEGAEINRARAMQDVQIRREAAAKTAAAKQAAKPAPPFPVVLGPETPTAKQLKSTQGVELSPIVKPATPAVEGEGRPATWTNDYVTRQAATGDTRAIQQARLRGLTLPPNANLVSNKAATVTPSVGTPKSVTLFDAQGNPVPSGGVAPMADVMAAKPAESKYLYRIRPVGEKGVPAGAANSPAQMTTSLEQAESWAPSKNEEGPHEIVRVPTSSLKPGQTSVRPYSEGIDWHKVNQAIPESDVEVVHPHPAEVESE